jgi:isoleucyl-tRNA synthetase
LLNVSEVDVQIVDATEFEVKAEHVPAAYQKCERCWHWEKAVGSHPDHPTLCPRCVEAVEAVIHG